MILGSIPFVSAWVVLIRRTLFRKKMAEVVKHSRTMKRLVQDIENSHQHERSDHSQNRKYGGEQMNLGPHQRKIKSKALPPLSTSRTFHHQTGFGFVSTPYFTSRAVELIKGYRTGTDAMGD